MEAATTAAPYHVVYIAEEWSLEYSIELPKGTKAGDRVDCGEWNSFEDFLEGALPGWYVFTNKHDEPTSVIVGDHPGLRVLY